MAAREGYLNAVKTLVKRESDINTKDNDGVSKTIHLRAWSHSSTQEKLCIHCFCIHVTLSVKIKHLG